MLLQFLLAAVLLIAAAEATGRADYEVSQHPFWRSSNLSTSEMVSRIHEFRDRFTQLPEEQKRWSMVYGIDEALPQFLFQVNNIEKEGFETYEETQEAISKAGALHLGDNVQSDKRLEALRCLDRAVKIFLNESSEISVSKVLKAHHELMASTKRDYAGHLRRELHEVVFTRTVRGGFHVFSWPTRVEAELDKLVESVNQEVKELTSIDEAEFSVESLEKLLKLGTRAFFDFENVHPFPDGNGRIGRIILASLLRSTGVMPFPNVLLVESNGADPPFVDKVAYYECFSNPQEEQKFETMNSVGNGAVRIVLSEETVANAKVYPPADLGALVIEGVYVGWKMFFNSRFADLSSLCNPDSEVRII